MAAIMGTIFYLSHQPGDFVQLPQVIGFDKLLHAVAYGFLAGAFFFGLQPFIHETNRTVAAFVVVLFCLLFAISDEFHQGFIPGRVVSAWDVAADCMGAMFAVGWELTKKAGKTKKECS